MEVGGFSNVRTHNGIKSTLITTDENETAYEFVLIHVDVAKWEAFLQSIRTDWDIQALFASSTDSCVFYGYDGSYLHIEAKPHRFMITNTRMIIDYIRSIIDLKKNQQRG